MQIEAPYIDGIHWIYPDGTRLLRVVGAEEPPEPLADQPPGTEETPGTETASQPETFSENFDPATLPDDLRPAYNQLRADYTRKTQSVAEQRREIEAKQQLVADLESDDPTRQTAALRYLGYDVPESLNEDHLAPTSPQEDEKYAALEQRLARFEQAEEQRTAQQQRDQADADFVSDLDAQISELETGLGRDLSDNEIRALTNQAVADIDDNGRANVRGAYDFLFGELFPSVAKSTAGKKRTAVQPPSGRPGEKQPDLKDDNTRRSLMAQIIEAGDES